MHESRTGHERETEPWEIVSETCQWLTRNLRQLQDTSIFYSRLSFSECTPLVRVPQVCLACCVVVVKADSSTGNYLWFICPVRNIPMHFPYIKTAILVLLKYLWSTCLLRHDHRGLLRTVPVEKMCMYVFQKLIVRLHHGHPNRSRHLACILRHAENILSFCPQTARKSPHGQL